MYIYIYWPLAEEVKSYVEDTKDIFNKASFFTKINWFMQNRCRDSYRNISHEEDLATISKWLDNWM